jgi:mRNA-degrading endonuclease toxin of MazEF toxin-antitoxin module
VPERQDVILIDGKLQAGREMRDLHPVLAPSPSAFNASTGLVLGLPMTAAAYDATSRFALASLPREHDRSGQAASQRRVQRSIRRRLRSTPDFPLAIRGGQ